MQLLYDERIVEIQTINVSLPSFPPSRTLASGVLPASSLPIQGQLTWFTCFDTVGQTLTAPAICSNT